MVSGVQKGDIYYYKEHQKNGKIHSIYFDYPKNSTETEKHIKWSEKILSDFKIK